METHSNIRYNHESPAVLAGGGRWRSGDRMYNHPGPLLSEDFICLHEKYSLAWPSYNHTDGIQCMGLTSRSCTEQTPTEFQAGAF